MKRLKELKDIEKIHFVGIGGAGMSPLAKIMVELGYEVTGSDRADSEVIQNLQKLGAKITLDGQKVRGNIYKCGDKLPVPHFISWSPISTPAPDFHCPRFFGEMDII